MCMLTAVYPERKPQKWEKQLTKLLITDLLLANAERGNRDGAGFLTVTGVLKKWEKSFGNVAFTDEYCACITDIVDEPFTAHVRTTSTGITAKEGAHPFVVGNIAVAHNGTFSNYRGRMKDTPGLKDKDPVDSHVFAHLLASEVGEDDLTSEHISNALRKMTGSYSMIITDLKTRTIWVVAGSNPLRRKKVGHLHIINTSDQTLDSTAAYISGVAKLLFNKPLEVGDTEKLDQYTIYTFDHTGLVKVGSAPKLETPASVAYRNYAARGTTYTSARREITTQEAIERARAVLSILENTWMTRCEIDMACTALFEAPWMSVDAELLGILDKVAQELQRSVTVEKSNLWRDIEDTLILPYEVIGKHMDIAFPWPLNSTKVLREILERIEKGEITLEE